MKRTTWLLIGLLAGLVASSCFGEEPKEASVYGDGIIHGEKGVFTYKGTLGAIKIAHPVLPSGYSLTTFGGEAPEWHIVDARGPRYKILFTLDKDKVNDLIMDVRKPVPPTSLESKEVTVQYEGVLYRCSAVAVSKDGTVRFLSPRPGPTKTAKFVAGSPFILKFEHSDF